MRPTLFIGSSREALKLAKAIKTELSKHFDVEIWSDPLFELGEDTLTNLLRFVQIYDFAILVLTDDDQTSSRKVSAKSPRDNVIFELGMFMGALGRRRAFAVVAKTKSGPPKLPSDLLGNTAIFLPPGLRKNPKPAVIRNHLSTVVSTIENRSKEATLQLLPSTALAIGYFNNFLLPVCKELTQRQSVEIAGKTVDISQDNFDITVVLPNSLSNASIEGARRYVKTAGITSFDLTTSTSRKYPFYVHAKLLKGRAVFYDYPTTLNASHEAIQIALAGPYLGKGKHHATLDAREISNFERTLRILLSAPQAAEFRDNVKLIQAP